MEHNVVKRITVGSNAFFSGIDGFRSKDTDVLLFIENPTDFNIERQTTLRRPIEKCIFEFRNAPKEFLIEHSLKSDCGMIVGKFLVPEVAEYLGMTIDDLKMLRPLIDKLDDRHLYEKVIYESYIRNNEFSLTEDQLAEAYAEYMKYKTR